MGKPFGGSAWRLDQGNASAQGMLGALYYNGDGVPQDYREAIRWSRMAADEGDARAQYVLGLMYYNGGGVPQDYVLAYAWINVAIAGYESDQRAPLVGVRDGLIRLMNRDQIAEAQRLSREIAERIEARERESEAPPRT